MIRQADKGDLPTIIALLEAYRGRIERWQPVFWKKAEASAILSDAWFSHLLTLDTTAFFIAEEEGEALGFLIANLIDAPPVYEPGGKTCMIDDYVVAKDEDWPTIGADLLAAAKEWAKQKSAAQVMVVAPSQHPAK